MRVLHFSGPARALLLLTAAVGACESDAPPAPPDVGPRDATSGGEGGSGETGAMCRSDLDCSDDRYCTGVETCVPGGPRADARGCVAGASSVCDPGETCDEASRRCVARSCAGDDGDADGDGRRSEACGGDDCDDGDSNRFPGNPEVCDPDGHDEDCDGMTYGYRDADSDDHADARCCNEVDARICGDDCNDMRAATHPTANDACNLIDDDCDGNVDEGTLETFYVDADGDDFGAMGGATTMGCSPPMGYADNATDCDDNNAMIHPAAVEVCDTPAAGEMPVDENCDGMRNPMATCACTAGMVNVDCGLPGACEAGVRDCVNGQWSPCSIQGTMEICDSVDNDCNDMVDDGVQETCFADADADTYAPSVAAPRMFCPVAGRDHVGGCPAGFTNRVPLGMDIDCNDGSMSIRPGGTETCSATSMVDEDCDTRIDEMLTTTCYADTDGDGFAPMGAVASQRCRTPSRPGGCPTGFTATAPGTRMVGGSLRSFTDCNDMQAAARPPGTDAAPQELCDRIDNDCSAGPTGMGVEAYEDFDNDGHAPATGATCTGGSLPRDDCADGEPRAFPGQTAYFQTPYCPGGSSWCEACSLCLADDPLPICDTSCQGDTRTPTYDYNCDGSDTREPFAALGCGTGSCVMFPGCLPSHYLDYGGAGCGQSVMYQSCRCTMFGCPSSIAARPLACR